MWKTLSHYQNQYKRFFLYKQHRYKGVSICFDMLKASLGGGYINFGVMRLYGDKALDDALGMFVKLVMSIPQRDLLVIIYFVLFSFVEGGW